MSDNNGDLPSGEDVGPPQLLSRIKPQASISLGPGFLAMRPQLAAIVTEIIALGSEIDLQRGRYLAALLGSNQMVGVAIFLAITSAVTRRDTLDAASKSILNDLEYELFTRTARAVKAVEKERNAFAHQLWGISDDLPDALLLVDAEYRLKHLLEIGALTRQRVIDIAQNTLAPTIQALPPLALLAALDPSKIYVYRKSDLERSRDRASGMHRFIHSFASLPNFPPGPARDRLRLQLLAELPHPKP
jgi:hypothetical protein